MESLKTRNINVDLVNTKEDALRKINKMIPQERSDDRGLDNS